MALLRLLRPNQWSKNLLVFAAMLFTGKFDAESVTRAVLAFLAMCMVSSATYVLNDIRDRDKDSLHPVKKNRPIASGDVTVQAALFVALLLIAVSTGLVLALGKAVSLVVATYLVLQVLYNLGAKNIAITDVFLIAFGFVLRAVLGAAAIGAAVSGWILLCTGALALLLGFGKRRSEFIMMGEDRGKSRTSLQAYSLPVLDALVIISASVASICYGIYALESPSAQKHSGLICTVPFVFYGVCRYVLRLFSPQNEEASEPEKLLFADKHLLASVILFVLSALFAMQGYSLPLIESGVR